jgi:hypothetical protein
MSSARLLFSRSWKETREADGGKQGESLIVGRGYKCVVHNQLRTAIVL